MAAGNSVFGYVDGVTGVPGQNQLYLDPSQMFQLQQHHQVQQIHQVQQPTGQHTQSQLQQQTHSQQGGAEISNISAPHNMMQQTLVPQGMPMQQMMPPGGMIISNGMGGFIQYGQTMTPGAMSPAYGVVPQGLGMGQMQMILQPTLSLRHAKPVGRTPIPRNVGISGTTGSGTGSDQSGAGKVKKKKPSPSARRRSRLRLIAFLEAKRKKAEEEGIPEEGTVEQIKALEKEQEMEDQALQAAAVGISPSNTTSATSVGTGSVSRSSSPSQPINPPPDQLAPLTQLAQLATSPVENNLEEATTPTETDHNVKQEQS